MKDKILESVFFLFIFFNCSNTNYIKIAEENPKLLVNMQDSLIQGSMNEKLQIALVKANNNLGLVEFRKESYDNARSYFLNTKTISNSDSLANFFLLLSEGNLLYKTGNKDNLWSAIQKYNRAIQFDPLNGLPYYFIGLSYQKIDDKDFDLIIEALQKAMLLSLDEKTRNKTKQVLENVRERERVLKDFWQ